MSNRQANSEFSAGNGVFALYLLLFFASLVCLWLLFHPKSPLRSYEDYYLLFPETGTLHQGSVVQVLGIPYGHVAAIDLRPDGVVAHAKIKPGIRIPKDSRFRVINVGLLGEREIEIKMGNSPEYFKDGDSSRGGYDVGSTRLMFLAKNLLKTADSALTTTIQVWDSTLGNPLVLARLNRSHKGAVRSVKRIQDVAGGVKDSLQLLQSQIHELQAQFAATKQEVQPGIQAASAEAKEILQWMGVLETRLQGLSTDATWLSERLQQGNGTLGLTLQSQEFRSRLAGTVQNVENLMGDIRKKGLDLNVDIF